MGKKSGFWMWLFVIFGILLASRTASNIIRLFKAGERVKFAQLEEEQLKIKRQDLEKMVALSETEGYVERVAREKLGMGKPGEVVVVLDGDSDSKLKLPDTEEEGSNWKMWRKLYFGF